MEDGHYVVRAELPGIHPARDVDVTVRDGQLMSKAGIATSSDHADLFAFSFRVGVRTTL